VATICLIFTSRSFSFCQQTTEESQTQVAEIRKTVQNRPFKAFEIHIDNGEKYLITHPENIFITNQIIVTVDEQGQTIYITPESISTIGIVNGRTYLSQHLPGIFKLQ